MVIGLEREGDRVSTSRKRTKTSTASVDTATTTDTGLTSTAVTREDTSLHSKVHEALRSVVKGAVSPCHLSIQLTVSDTTASLNGVATLIDQLKCMDIRGGMFPRLTYHSEPTAHCGQAVRVCVVGLHCCGDLAPVVLELFASQVHPDIHVLVLLGCCYHKMSHTGTHLTHPVQPLPYTW